MYGKKKQTQTSSAGLLAIQVIDAAVIRSQLRSLRTVNMGRCTDFKEEKGHTSQRSKIIIYIFSNMTPTSKDILEQCEALRIWRAAQAWAISRKVSLLRQEELETSSDSS